MKFELVFVLGGFTAISFWIFQKVFATSQQVIDEEFHLRQGLHFCNGRFDVWDKKITTFPGLYFLSTALLAPLGLCSAFYLRLTSFLCLVVNFGLFYEIRKLSSGNRVALLEALTLSLLPPSYFFGHLYYTDVPALTFVLLALLASLRGKHVWGALAGILSVAMRQTNIIWVAFIFGVNACNSIVGRAHPFLKGKGSSGGFKYSWEDLKTVLNVYFHRPSLVLRHGKEILVQYFGYLATLAGFLGFLWWNGSIVVGDKCAHEAAVHLPQLLYFSLFVVFFAPSLLLTKLRPVLTHLHQKWYIYTYIFVLLAAIIRLNTLVHPYLLADNRHYVFYAWNRFLGKFPWAAYSLLPIYVVSLSAILHFLKEQHSAGFILCYTICTVASLALQKLLEVRYFILPYVILRLHLRNIKPKLVVLELVLYLALNSATFYLFFTKEIWWNDYKEAQRLIW